MNDYIKRQDAIDTHCAICPDKDKCPDGDFICPDRELFRMIKPVCPEPPKIGKWLYRIGRGGAGWICSECGERTVSAVMGKPRYIYCPICGARNQTEE